MNGFEYIFYLIGIFATIIWITKLFREAFEGTFYTLRKFAILLGASIFFKKKTLKQKKNKDDIYKNKQMS
jgi:hypothetical protein